MQIDFLGSMFQYLTCLEVEISSTLINELKVSFVTLLFH